MKRMAIFVEGQTEQIFVERLLKEIAGQHRISINKLKFKEGNKIKRFAQLIDTEAVSPNTKYYFIIYNCDTDNRVMSDVRDQYESLAKNGYTAITAIRDTYPEIKYEQLKEARQRLKFGIKTKPVEVLIVL